VLNAVGANHVDDFYWMQSARYLHKQRRIQQFFDGISISGVAVIAIRDLAVCGLSVSGRKRRFFQPYLHEKYCFYDGDFSLKFSQR
jgi:hypothetical protein